MRVLNFLSELAGNFDANISTHCRPVVTGGAGGTHRSWQIQPEGANYAHQITTGTRKISDLPMSLH